MILVYFFTPIEKLIVILRIFSLYNVGYELMCMKNLYFPIFWNSLADMLKIFNFNSEVNVYFDVFVEAFETKWVNSIINIMKIDLLRLGGLHIICVKGLIYFSIVILFNWFNLNCLMQLNRNICIVELIFESYLSFALS